MTILDINYKNRNVPADGERPCPSYTLNGPEGHDYIMLESIIDYDVSNTTINIFTTNEAYVFNNENIPEMHLSLLSNVQFAKLEKILMEVKNEIIDI